MTEPAETNGNLLACHAISRAEARGTCHYWHGSMTQN